MEQNRGKMKMQKLLVLLLLLPILIFAKKVADLPEVMKMSSIHVSGDRIFLCEDKTIHIYSLNDFKHIKQFGKEGEGPGEFNFRVNLEVFPGKLVVTTFKKMIIFSHDGTVIKEYKISPEILRMYPVKSNFVGSSFEKKVQKINIYDKNIKILKTIYEGSIGSVSYFESGKKNDIIMVKDYVASHVYKDKIYIFDTERGFFVSVLNSSGKILYEINKEYKSLKVTEEYKNMRMRIEQAEPNWEKKKKMFNYLFPEYFPAFRIVRISEDKIYFITYKNINKRYETIVTDLKGNVLRKIFIPVVPYDRLLFSINKDKFYYLIEDEDEEMWELHVEDLKQKI